MALVANLVLLRDVIATRLPDAIALTAVLAAWIAGGIDSEADAPCNRARRIHHRRGACQVEAQVARLRDADARKGGPRGLQPCRRCCGPKRRRSIPNRERLPLIRYLSSCTPPTSRVLVSGFGPEIPVLAHRPFAGGAPLVDSGIQHAPARRRTRGCDSHESRCRWRSCSKDRRRSSTSGRRLAADLRARRFVERTWRLDGTRSSSGFPRMSPRERRPAAAMPC